MVAIVTIIIFSLAIAVITVKMLRSLNLTDYKHSLTTRKFKACKKWVIVNNRVIQVR